MNINDIPMSCIYMPALNFKMLFETRSSNLLILKI